MRDISKNVSQPGGRMSGKKIHRLAKPISLPVMTGVYPISRSEFKEDCREMEQNTQSDSDSDDSVKSEDVINSVYPVKPRKTPKGNQRSTRSTIQQYGETEDEYAESGGEETYEFFRLVEENRQDIFVAEKSCEKMEVHYQALRDTFIVTTKRFQHEQNTQNNFISSMQGICARLMHLYNAKCSRNQMLVDTLTTLRRRIQSAKTIQHELENIKSAIVEMPAQTLNNDNRKTIPQKKYNDSTMALRVNCKQSGNLVLLYVHQYIRTPLGVAQVLSLHPSKESILLKLSFGLMYANIRRVVTWGLHVESSKTEVNDELMEQCDTSDASPDELSSIDASSDLALRLSWKHLGDDRLGMTWDTAREIRHAIASGGSVSNRSSSRQIVSGGDGEDTDKDEEDSVSPEDILQSSIITTPMDISGHPNDTEKTDAKASHPVPSSPSPPSPAPHPVHGMEMRSHSTSVHSSFSSSTYNHDHPEKSSTSTFTPSLRLDPVSGSTSDVPPHISNMEGRESATAASSTRPQQSQAEEAAGNAANGLATGIGLGRGTDIEKMVSPISYDSLPYIFSPNVTLPKVIETMLQREGKDPLVIHQALIPPSQLHSQLTAEETHLEMSVKSLYSDLAAVSTRQSLAMQRVEETRRTARQLMERVARVRLGMFTRRARQLALRHHSYRMAAAAGASTTQRGAGGHSHPSDPAASSQIEFSTTYSNVTSAAYNSAGSDHLFAVPVRLTKSNSRIGTRTAAASGSTAAATATARESRAAAERSRCAAMVVTATATAAATTATASTTVSESETEGELSQGTTDSRATATATTTATTAPTATGSGSGSGRSKREGVEARQAISIAAIVASEAQLSAEIGRENTLKRKGSAALNLSETTANTRKKPKQKRNSASQDPSPVDQSESETTLDASPPPPLPTTTTTTTTTTAVKRSVRESNLNNQKTVTATTATTTGGAAAAAAVEDEEVVVGNPKTVRNNNNNNHSISTSAQIVEEESNQDQSIKRKKRPRKL